MDYPAFIPHARRALILAICVVLAGCQHGAPATEDGPPQARADDGGSESIDWQRAAQTPEVCDNGEDDDGDGFGDCEDSECGPAAGCEVTWKEMSLGEGLACALGDNGGAWCWGNGEPRPARLDIERPIDDVALVARQSCAVLGERVQCWHSGRSAGRTELEFSELAGSEGVEEIAAGPMSLCGRAGKQARCWGPFGELSPESRPITRYQDPSAFIQQRPQTHSFEKRLSEVSVGGYHACALDEAGRGYCWGRNAFGQLGDATTDDRDEPVEVITDRKFRSIAAGFVHTCGVSTKGELLCWGGQLIARETEESEHVAMEAGRERGPMYRARPEVAAVTTATDYVSVSAGRDFSCATTEQGEVRCWGINDLGQLADGTTERSDEPVALAVGGPFSQVATGQEFGCAVGESSAIRCWGNSRKAETGDQQMRFRKSPKRWGQWPGDEGRIARVAPLRGEPCLLSTTGEIACVSNVATVVSRSFADKIGRRRSSREQPTILDAEVAGVAAGGRHLCVWDVDGVARCSGDNGHGQLGIGSHSMGSAEAHAVGGELRFVQMAASHRHTCGVTPEGAVYCWGDDRHGQASGAEGEVAWTPRRLDLKEKVEQVVAGYAHSCALGKSGEAWCWGENIRGQLGDGTTEARRGPVAVAGELEFSRLATAGKHTCGLTKEGEVHCWGDNTERQVSSARKAVVSEPVRVSSLPAMNKLTTGYSYSCAAGEDGEMFCWGGAFGRSPHVAFADKKLADIAGGLAELCMTDEDGGFGCTRERGMLRETNFIEKPVDVEFGSDE